jgi:flagellum-specific ATP synthase
MKEIVSEEQQDAANALKRLLSIYKDSEDLINIGAYQQGSNKEIDLALQYIEDIHAFTRQKTNEKVTLGETQESLINQFLRS